MDLDAIPHSQFSRCIELTDHHRCPPRPVDGHKGLFGRVLIVGGNLDMIGAPVMAGAAALRMGSGLVQIAMPAPVLAIALSVVAGIDRIVAG